MGVFKLAMQNRKLLEQSNLKWSILSRFLISSNESHNVESEIVKNTVITRNHLTPELSLRLITPECDLWHSKYSEPIFPNDPFWGFYWPGGQALGRYILDNKQHFEKKNVLDLGSGSGACALAAAKCGAQSVLANDIDPASITAINLNSKLNNLRVHTCENDLIGQDIDSLIIESNGETLQLNWNVILVGDMFYDIELSKQLFIWLTELVGKNKLVLLGDPGRHPLAELNSLKEFGVLVKIAEYGLSNKEHYSFSSSSVFKIETSKRKTEALT